MDISIWFEVTTAPWGGGNQFLGALKAELVRLGHHVSDRPQRGADIVLVNAFLLRAGTPISLPKLRRVRRRGVARWLGPRALPAGDRPVVVHRLDGVAELIRGRRTSADDLQPQVNALADFTIFQSEYSRRVFAESGVNPARSCVIYNGVDPKIFFPGPKKSPPTGPLKLIAVSWSDNPRKGFATLAEISRVPGVVLSFVGRWPESVDPQQVELLGSRRSDEIAALLRDADACVHAAIHEPCSNAIIEALATGLPVLYRNSGGNEELAGLYGVPISDRHDDDITLLRDQLNTLRERALDDRARFSIGRAAAEYVVSFEEARRSVRATQ